VPLPRNYRGEWTVLIRSTGAVQSLIPAIRRIISEMDPGLPIVNMRTLSEQLKISLMQVRGGAFIVGLLGLLALALASMGLYGVVSCSVSRRTKEIGIRIAVGGQHATVLRQLMSDGVRLMIKGFVIGFVVAEVISHAAQSALNGIGTSDPLAYLGASLLLGAITLVACYIPARKALNADPMSALRCE
jgi:putative ABC transport system permease protein